MEAFTLGRLVDRWMADENITRFIRDQGTSLMVVLKQKGWDLVELFDKNHVIISWKRLYQELQWVPAQCETPKRASWSETPSQKVVLHMNTDG
jgi:hypothetical protein